MIEIDAIFFDVDGTLVDSRKDIANAVNYVLRQLGLKEKPSGEIVSYIGTGVKDLIRRSVGGDEDALIARGVETFSDYYVRHPADESKLYPHVKETLDYFTEKRKFILTNRYAAFADITLKAFAIRDYFEGIIGGDDEGCLKPSACVLTESFPSLKIDRERALVVGDMAIDVMTGKNSGVQTCWVSYGLGKMGDVQGLKPDYMIDDIAQLRRIIV